MALSRSADIARCWAGRGALRRAPGTSSALGTGVKHISEQKAAVDRPCAEPSCGHQHADHRDGTGTGPEAGTGCRMCDCWIYTTRSRLFGRRVFWATIGLVGRGFAGAAGPPR